MRILKGALLHLQSPFQLCVGCYATSCHSGDQLWRESGRASGCFEQGISVSSKQEGSGGQVYDCLQALPHTLACNARLERQVRRTEVHGGGADHVCAWGPRKVKLPWTPQVEDGTEGIGGLGYSLIWSDPLRQVSTELCQHALDS